MSRFIITLLAAATGIATPALAAQRDSPDVQLQKALAGRVAGTPVNCISTFSTTSSQIIDGKAIVYRAGNRLYVNEPRSGASQLDDDDVLVTRIFGGQLCSIDAVQLFDRTGGFQRGFVVLGKFVPYTKPKR